MEHQGTAMVVGASRGLGLALVEEWLGRGWRVIATVRNNPDGLDALAGRFPGEPGLETVDIAHAGPVRALRDRLGGRQLDVLFINAGIARAIERRRCSVDEEDFLDMMLVNALSPVRAAEILGDSCRPGGTIAIMTSELGSIANATGGWQLYSSSKAALNMLMKGYAARPPGRPRAAARGTGLGPHRDGRREATLSIEESIPLVVDMVEANRGKPGLRYVDRFNKAIPW